MRRIRLFVSCVSVLVYGDVTHDESLAIVFASKNNEYTDIYVSIIQHYVLHHQHKERQRVTAIIMHIQYLRDHMMTYTSNQKTRVYYKQYVRISYIFYIHWISTILHEKNQDGEKKDIIIL